MNKFYKTLSILFAGMILSVGCEDFTDIDPEFAQDADSYFNAPADYEQALVGAYDLLQTSYLSLWIGEIASDNAIAGGESVTDSEGLHQIDAMTHGGVNNELRSIFRWNYAGVTRANYIFENKDNIDFEGKDEILAQAAFLRAYYYFELVKFFGAVPLVIDRRLSPDELASVPRSPATEVYAQIEEDLTYAAGILDWTAEQKGRITKGAALALLGKAHLYQNEFAEAATVLDRVINEGPYALFQGDYNGIFRVVNEGNPEVVFDVQYTGIEGGSYDCFVCLEGFAAVGFHSIRGYNGPIYSDGNSYNLPTQELVDAFEAGDPRLEGAILDIEAFIAANPDVEITYAEGGGGHTGYYNNKYSKRLDELGPPDTDLTSPVNHIVIRYADVLLMAAEAHARKANPNEEQARQYLNQVRERVDLEPVNASGEALLNAIYQERRVELAGEGHRFFDLVRTGRAAQEIDGFQTGRHELFPIPQAEIDLARAGWQQNPGYNN
ncbi:RagB/SusD family nutrient uptake outer membrane protein [Cesiribacter sp. SM1]|uniref:RagB/SusD family nutrient uptake outer membrane protein n=1 Tax=Cesiribacter sp. SM1 TaxID=2861196 RepID=UPI001CD413A3|nr:RagB/SusD family nutrient uptake outer membrane protein [Cesiribacter sp. SM1]